MKAAIVYNPSAGRGRGGAVAEAVRKGLERRQIMAELHATTRPGEATLITQRIAARSDCVVAVGGDGTVNEVINGLADSRARLAIVPAGTVNVLATELGLPFEVEQACEAIARGKSLCLDLGKVNERRFVLMAGAGLDALTVRHVDPRSKRRFKELAFVGAGLGQSLAAKPPVFRVQLEDREYLATFFVASNSRHYADRLALTPQADPTDGALDFLIFTGTSRSSLLVFWLGVPSGLHLHDARVSCVRGREATLTPICKDTPVWLQTDGELAGRLPAQIRVEPSALEVLVP